MNYSEAAIGEPMVSEFQKYYDHETQEENHYSWMHYWNCMGSTDGVQFGDGGGTDNIGVLPALRRGVRKLIVCCALGKAPDNDFAGYNWDISGYFGATPDGQGPSVRAGNVDAAAWNNHVRVFERAAWDRLLAQILSQHAAGRPLCARVQSFVLPNLAQGVQGNYVVDMLWFFNGGADAWMEQVPERTSKDLMRLFSSFPYVPTELMDYPPILVNCLSNLASWSVLQSRDHVANFLGPDAPMR